MANIIRYKNFDSDFIHTEFLDKFEKEINSIIPCSHRNIKSFKEQIDSILPALGAAKRIKVDVDSQMYITGIYKKLGICIQFGNVSRFYADLIKLQHLYISGVIVEGLIISLNKELHSHFSLSNCTSFQRASKEMGIFKTFINSPIMILGVNE